MKDTVPSWNLAFNAEVRISFGESFHKTPIPKKKEIKKEQTKRKSSQQQEQYGIS